jgi:hypothetical protein
MNILTISKSRTSFISLFLTLSVALISSCTSASTIHKKLLKAADSDASGEYVRSSFLKKIKKPFKSSSKKKALIIGDSHAQDFYNSIIENNFLADYQISTRYIPVRCQIIMDEDSTSFIKEKDKNFCEESDSLAKAKKQIAEADLIILASYWKEWAAKKLPQTITRLELKPKQKLFVIGRKSYGKISIRNYLRMPEEKLRHLRTKVDKDQKHINDIMSETLSENIFVNQHKLVCESAKDCPVFTDDVELISFDGGHLTKAGAKYVGKILFEKSQLNQL